MYNTCIPEIKVFGQVDLLKCVKQSGLFVNFVGLGIVADGYGHRLFTVVYIVATYESDCCALLNEHRIPACGEADEPNDAYKFSTVKVNETNA